MKEELAIFKACADETRLRILYLLAQGELCVCELVAVLNMPQGKISRHLGILKQAGWVQDRREGTWIYYALAKGEIKLKYILIDYFEKNEPNRVAEDKTKLKELADRGEICTPNPSPTLAGKHT